MADLFSRDYTNNSAYDTRRQKTVIIVAGVLVATIFLALMIYFFSSTSPQEKYIKSATEAARKSIPNAKVNDIKVAGGFALAVVNDPTASGQAEAGSTTIFRINKDNSMTQLATGSYFDPIQLITLGIPLDTQAKLTGLAIGKVKANLATTCGYSGGSTPGYSGFDASFNPNGWQIDPLTLSSLGESLSDVIVKKNTTGNYNERTICVNAIQEGSSIINGTFTIAVQFITSNGTLTKHAISYTIDSGYGRSYVLDGQQI